MFEAPEKNESFRVGQLRQAYTGEICDEWSDDEDNCPAIANPDQADEDGEVEEFDDKSDKSNATA